MICKYDKLFKIALCLNNLKSPSNKNALCYVWLGGSRKKSQNMKSFHVQSCGIDTSANSLTKTSEQYHEFDIELDYP